MVNNIYQWSVGAFSLLVSYCFGGFSSLLGCLIAFIALDYFTGILSAGVNGKLSSKVGFKGISKKVLMLCIVCLAHLMDVALNTEDVLMDAAIYFYIANEALSIVENAGNTGLPIPDKVRQAIAVLKKR